MLKPKDKVKTASKNISRVSALICAAVMVAAPALSAPRAQELIFSAEVAAQGRREHVVQVNQWGRYSVEAKSAEGAAPEIADKRRGVFKSERRDGRFDVFLEAGRYKVFTEGPPDANGKLNLTVTKYSFAGPRADSSGSTTYEYLKPFEQAAAELGAMEARGWWIFVPRDTLVYIEAMGRRLGGLAVFRNGELLAAHAEDPDGFVNTNAPNKPLNWLRVIKRLERGKYLIAAYGGGKDRFAASDDKNPLYAQWMLDPVAPGRQVSAEINAGGVNRYIIPPNVYASGAEYLAVESPEKEKLFVDYYGIKEDNSDTINLISRDTVYGNQPNQKVLVKLKKYYGSGMLSISGKPGSVFRITPLRSRYRLNHFDIAEKDEDGTYQLSTVHTGFSDGSVGASGVLVDMADTSIAALQADTVSSARVLHRKFNLLANVTSYLWVGETGTYTFRTYGAAGYEWRVKRFFVSEPSDYNAPRRTKGRADVTLNKGLHVIEIYPTARGVAAFTVAGKSAGIVDTDVEAASPRPSVTFKPLKLKKDNRYRFYLNSQWPELSSPHVDTVSTEEMPAVTGDAVWREEADTSRVPELKLGIPQYADMNKNGFKTYQLTIGEAGVYKIETTGRLRTKLSLRGFLDDAFEYTDSGGGAGRNALIAAYLPPGRYAITAECGDVSAGRMGIIANKGDLQGGGGLRDGIDKRAAVKAHGAAVYDFTAERSGRYAFESFDQSGPARVRLEDSEGWPLFNYAGHPREIDLEKGKYKIYSLPSAYDTYRVTRARRAAEKRTEAVGFGPHVIRINDTVPARWTAPVRASDSAAPANRPARFTFETPARTEAKITLSPDFRGVLKPQNKDTALTKIRGVYNGVLEKGKYEIAVTPVKENNHAPYELSITTTDLLAGINYDIDTLRDMRVRIGEAGVYEIFSRGKHEISARLYREDQKTEAARARGGQQDWNFVISERLEAGKYFLRFTNYEPKTLSTRIFMRRVEDTLTQAVKLNGADAVESKITLSGKSAVIPIECSYGDVLILKAESESDIICELETSQKSGAAVIGRASGKQVKISAPVDKKNKYALRIWADGGNSCDAALEIKTVEALPLTYKKALGGVTGTAAKERGNTVFFKISGMPPGPGHYELITTQNDVSGAAGVNAADRMFQEEEGSLIASAGKQLWIEAEFAAAEHYRFVLSPVHVTDVKEISEKNKRKFETSDKYRFSKNRIKYFERNELPVTIKPNREKIFELDAPVQKFGLVTFSTTSGRPLAGLSAPAGGAADFVRGGIPVFGGQYSDGGVCLTAVVPGDTGRLVGWNALAGGSAEGIGGSFTMKNYATEKADTLKPGLTAWTAEPARAKAYIVPQNRGLTAVVKLSPRAGLFYVPRGGRRDMYYGGEEGARHTIEPDGGKIFLFGGADGGSVELEVYASPPRNDGRGQPRELGAGTEIVRQFAIDTRETVRVKNEVMAHRRLFCSGAVKSMEWINRFGQITPGIKDEHLLSGEGGVLLVSSAAGWGKLRLCRDDGSRLALNECQWGGGGVKKDGAPTVKEMSRLIMADGVNWYSVELSERTHISVNAPIPAAAIIAVDGKVRDYEEFWEELAWDVPLASGKFTIGIKPLAGRASAGVPLTIRFYPVSLLTENKPLDMYLMAGEKRMARFDVRKKSKIGVGLSMSGETAEAVITDGRGKIFGRGKQIFAELEKGTYYALLSAAPASSGTNVKLYLFGQDNPPVSPPPDVVKWIIKGGAGERPSGAAAQAASDEADDEE